MSALSVKLHLSSDDIRRFSFQQDAGLEGLRRYVAREYLQDSGSLDLAYTDEEGDRIALSNAGDWAEALRLHSQGQVFHLYVKTATSNFPSSSATASKSAAAPPPAAASAGGAAPGAAPFNFASLFGGGPGAGQQQGGVNPLEQLLGLAKTPQGSALLKSFGMSPESAAAMVAQFAAGGGLPKMPPQAAAAAAAGNSSSSSSSSNNNNEESKSEDTMLICDECDLPIEASAGRLHCLDCAGSYDVHEACRKDTHDAAHRFETVGGAQDDVAKLMELGGVSRECAVEMLSRNNGNFSASLDQLLK